MADNPNTIFNRVGPGTPMGNVFRRFWLPAVLSKQMPEPDGAPVRLRILCEDLLAFRDSNGNVGIVSAYCRHRLAPLFFGRNEQCGLRCVYHGWKWNTNGDCVDIPNVQPPQNYDELKEKARLKSYPTIEKNGLVWVYMGPKDKQPPLPSFEWMQVPEDHVSVTVRRQIIRDSWRLRLAECWPHLGVDIRRRACGAASAAVRWSVA